MKAYILAGGRGSRLSPTKGFETVGGVAIVERATAAAAAVAEEVVAVGAAEGLSELGLRLVADEPGDRAGPLAGVCAALVDAAPGDALVLPWDAPFVAPALLRYMVEVKAGAGIDAVVPRRADRAEPLFAVYGPECRRPALSALERGERRVIAFFDDVTVRWLDEGELRQYGEWERLFFNVNTPADLAQARGMAEAHR